jgi:hypothetical protein
VGKDEYLYSKGGDVMTEIYGISHSVKTTTIKQECLYCKKEIAKGNIRVKMVGGAYFNHPTYDYYHKECFIKGMTEFLAALKVAYK